MTDNDFGRLIEVTPKTLRELILLHFELNQPLFIHGSPGLGKSQIARQCSDEYFGPQWDDYTQPEEQVTLKTIVERYGKDPAPNHIWDDFFDPPWFRDPRATLLDSVDLRGTPMPYAGATVWMSPVFLPKHRSGCILYDELAATQSGTQVACYQLISDRALGEYRLPKEWRQLAAGNLVTDRSAVQKMSKALSRRFTHCLLKPSVKQWCEYAVKKDFAPEVIAYIRFREAENEGALFDFDPKSAEFAFANPASWEKISNIVKAKPSKSISLAAYCGTVGSGHGLGFHGFLSILHELPTIEQIEGNPRGAKVPQKMSAQYAIVGSLVKHATRGMMSTFSEYIARLPKEFQALFYTDSQTKDKDLANTQSFINWTQENPGLLGNFA